MVIIYLISFLLRNTFRIYYNGIRCCLWVLKKYDSSEKRKRKKIKSFYGFPKCFVVPTFFFIIHLLSIWVEEKEFSVFVLYDWLIWDSLKIGPMKLQLWSQPKISWNSIIHTFKITLCPNKESKNMVHCEIKQMDLIKFVCIEVTNILSCRFCCNFMELSACGF